jgi:hypothetical protein
MGVPLLTGLPLDRRGAAEAALATSVIREVAKRLAMKDDRGLRARFAKAVEAAPADVLAQAFHLAKGTLVNANLRAVVWELERAAHG